MRSQFVVFIFMLATLACGLNQKQNPAADGANGIVRLPTLTPTPLPSLTPTASPGGAPDLTTSSPTGTTAARISSSQPSSAGMPVASASQPTRLNGEAEANLPPEATAATPTPVISRNPDPLPEASGWSFAGVQLLDNQYEAGLLLLGELINNTGTTQKLFSVSGTFYDSQGRVIADENSTSDYWPLEIIPPGGRMPFGMFVDGIKGAADFELSVTAEISHELLAQDFEFLEVEQWQGREDYCLQGKLRVPDRNLSEFVAITAILYDSQNKVVNFGGTSSTDFAGIASDLLSDFEICIAPPNQNVSRYELRAWGQ